MTFARWVSTPETRSALAAVQDVVTHLVCREPHYFPNPLLLHGPAGTGKTHLVSALAAEVTRERAELVVTLLAAAAFREDNGNPESSAIDREAIGQSDLFIVEDLQHLPGRAVEPLAALVDELHARRCPMVFTALAGPRHLANLSARLVSRLVGGLVVQLEALSAASRFAVLQDKAQRRQLAVSRDVLSWLAKHLTGGGRQLEGAIARLESLARMPNCPMDVAFVADQFHAEVKAGRPTVERIAQRVGGYFEVELRQLKSRKRSRQAMLPRQVGMYLARQLTGLSLDQIGAYFGGRDHSTVLYACRKVEHALDRDAILSGAVRQLHADLA
jgi:chromosomal replication initiator protein